MHDPGCKLGSLRRATFAHSSRRISASRLSLDYVRRAWRGPGDCVVRLDAVLRFRRVDHSHSGNRQACRCAGGGDASSVVLRRASLARRDVPMHVEADRHRHVATFPPLASGPPTETSRCPIHCVAPVGGRTTFNGDAVSACTESGDRKAEISEGPEQAHHRAARRLCIDVAKRQIYITDRRAGPCAAWQPA
jgi:hypothetical protein